MKIWFQLLSSETGMKGFLAATQKLVDRAMSPGTTVEVRGTTHGVIGDQYRLFCNYDTREVIDNALRIRAEGGYDAFVIANSMDPVLVELREMLDSAAMPPAPPRRKSRPTRGSVERRLDSKRRESQKKESRRTDNW